MKLRNFLVDLLSSIIEDKTKLLSDTKNDMKKISDYKRIEELFSDVNNLLDVSDDDIRNVLLDITDEDTVNGILSNIDMVRIVLNGKKSGLDLDLDKSQEELIKSVFDIVNNHRNDLESRNAEVRNSLTEFISKCQSLGSEISSGVVRDIDTLNGIFVENNVPVEDVVNCKFEILRNNSENYNLNLEGKVKEEIDLKIVLKRIDVDLDSFGDIRKNILINYSSIDDVKDIIDYIERNELIFDISNLFILLLFSNVSIISSVLDFANSYDMSIDDLFKIPGVFISTNNKDKAINIINEFSSDSDFGAIENLKYIGAYYETFVDNISLLESDNKSVSECFANNILSLIVPDISKNINILSDLNLSNKEFSIVVINPFLATSRSSFVECGLSEYINSNPIRLTTSYHRLKIISSNIISARKNGQVIFRSLSDKKNYWLASNITRENTVSEVI